MSLQVVFAYIFRVRRRRCLRTNMVQVAIKAHINKQPLKEQLYDSWSSKKLESGI